MQQRQPRLGDILDDYCPRERRVTNHAVVAMVDADVKQTRCTTCDAEHDYKHAKVPRQRKKLDSPAVLYAQVLAGGPKRVSHESPVPAPLPPSTDYSGDDVEADDDPRGAETDAETEMRGADDDDEIVLHTAETMPIDAVEDDIDDGEDQQPAAVPAEEGPVHRRLIRAQLPRIEGQPPPARQAPDFTIRQPAGRTNRFQRPRGPRGAANGGGQFQGQGNRSSTGGNGNGSGGPMRSGTQGHGGGDRPPMMSRLAKRQGSGRKRSK